jgi:hypothetical protein
MTTEISHRQNLLDKTARAAKFKVCEKHSSHNDFPAITGRP